MLASLFRPRSGRKHSGESGVSPSSRGRYRRVQTQTYHDEEPSEEEDEVYDDGEQYNEQEEEEIEGEDGDDDPLLPIFSAEVLGTYLPNAQD